MEANEGYLKRFTRELPVALDDHELQTYGKMLAEKVREEELAEEKKKQVTSEHSNRIKTIRVEIKRIADARAKGEELRPVACGERLHGNVIEVVRLDRGVVVDTRPADLQDLQTTIPGTGGGMPEIPDGFDEGPRGDDFGGPNKTGLSIVREVQDTPGVMSTSSSGDVVYNGAPEDVAVPEDGYDVPEQPDDPEDEGEPDASLAEDAEGDAQADALKLAECAMCSEPVLEGQPYEVIGTGRMVHAGCLPALPGAAPNGTHVAAKPGRDRSRKSNEAKGTSKAGKVKRKK